MNVPRSYTLQYTLGIVVTVALAALGAIQATGAATLGLDGHTVAWLGIVSAALGVLNGLLPRLTARPTDRREGLD